MAGAIAGMKGLSPRRRGNHAPYCRLATALGPIPAQAGEPLERILARNLQRAYPRAGGGTEPIVMSRSPDMGLSPRRRGNLVEGEVAPLERGPIPAQAGEPTPTRTSLRRPRAYPRAGGGTDAEIDAEYDAAGLSPRRRGNPRLPPPRRFFARAYPRAGGGTASITSLKAADAGLSPRRRGNRELFAWGFLVVGPIPAQAGEPRHRELPRVGFGAYPRAGGGTRGLAGDRRHAVGLSPRRRGNLSNWPNSLRFHGPIPAQAGEPRSRTFFAVSARAYPRAGGGTRDESGAEHCAEGLSPRRRGNLVRHAQQPSGDRPIPAQAGEPGSAMPNSRHRRAYPRAGGGTRGPDLATIK